MYTNKKGVSNAVVGVLIVVALVIVIVATIAILDRTQEVNQKTAPVSSAGLESSGRIQLDIAGSKVRNTGTTGMITLNVQ
jgi:hypothetical protein